LLSSVFRSALPDNQRPSHVPKVDVINWEYAIKRDDCPGHGKHVWPSAWRGAWLMHGARGTCRGLAWLRSSFSFPSVRITSQKSFNGHLVIADLAAMPCGCSVWPGPSAPIVWWWRDRRCRMCQCQSNVNPLRCVSWFSNLTSRSMDH